MKLTRREFLAVAAGSAGGLGLAKGPAMKQALFAPGARRIRYGPGVERFVASTCSLCPAGCGLLARVVDGHVVKLEGNPLHPVNRGRLCALGQAGVQLMYSPDRVSQPLLRDGPKGTSTFKTISWKDATDLVKSKVLDAYGSGQGHRIVTVDGGGTMTSRLWKRLLSSLGSPNHVLDRSPDPMESACYLTQGLHVRPEYDLARAKYVLSLGAPLLESWWSPVQMQRIYANRAAESVRSRMKLVQFDTRYSITAALADEWHAVKPGGFLALALSLAYVIVKESFHDQEFVARNTTGFLKSTANDGETGMGFRELLLRDCNPDVLSSISGVPTETVHRLAKEISTDHPGVVVCDASVGEHPHAVQTAWAVQCLNALLGSIDVPGGVVFPDEAPLSEDPRLDSDPLATRSLENPRIDGAGIDESPAVGQLDRLGDALLSGSPYSPSVLFLHHSNPLYSSPDPDRFERALRKVPFVVSFTPFQDETLTVADLIVPDAIYLERWENVISSAESGQTVVSLSQPVLTPRLDVRATSDFLLDLMRVMGPRFAKATPWKDSRELVLQSHRGLFESTRGTVFTEDLEEAQLAALEERGWWFATHKKFAAFSKAIQKNGGWWDPVYMSGRWGRVFCTPSRSFEFRSSLLRKWVDTRSKLEMAAANRTEAEARAQVLMALGLGTSEDAAYLPQVPKAVAPAASEPSLTLVAYRPLTRSSAILGRLPVLVDVLGMHIDGRPIFWVEVSPVDAEPLGLVDGRWVKVQTDVGSIDACVRIVEANPPGVVAIPAGFGQDRPNVARIGSNVNRLLPGDLDPIGQTSGLSGIRARLVPIKEGAGNV